MTAKRATIFALLIALATTGNAQFESSKQVYRAPTLPTEIARHKTVAILPFAATITYKKQPKDFNADAKKADEEKLATDMQQGMYTYLLRKADKYSVNFQDVDRTNVLLKQAGLYQKLGEVTHDSVCKVLGVDAVIKSSYAYERTASDAGAIAKGVLLGAAFSTTGAGALTMQVYNGKDGALLWRFYKEMNENVMGNSNQVMERMMRKVARNFPYETD